MGTRDGQAFPTCVQWETGWALLGGTGMGEVTLDLWIMEESRSQTLRDIISQRRGWREGGGEGVWEGTFPFVFLLWKEGQRTQLQIVDEKRKRLATSRGNGNESKRISMIMTIKRKEISLLFEITFLIYPSHTLHTQTNSQQARTASGYSVVDRYTDCPLASYFRGSPFIIIITNPY